MASATELVELFGLTIPLDSSAAMPWIVARRTRRRVRLATLESALRLSLLDQLEHDGEGAFGGLVQRAGLLAVLAREHQLQQRGVARGEADIGRRRRLQARLEFLSRAIGGSAQFGAQAVVPGLGESVEQRLAIGEVAPRRAVTDADLACQLAQRQLLHAAFAHRALGLLQERRAEVAVMVGALVHPSLRVAVEVVVDIFVVIA